MDKTEKLTLRECLLGDRAFYRHVLLVVLPIIVQNTLTNVVSLLDNVMVGQVGTLPMSGVAVVGQLLFVYNLAIWGSTSGAGIFGAQFYGRGDMDGVRHTFRFKLLVSTAITAAAIMLFLAAGLPARHGRGAEPHARTDAQHDPVDRRHPVPRRCAGRNPHLGLVGGRDQVDEHDGLPAPVQSGWCHGLLAQPQGRQQKAHRGSMRRVRAGAGAEQCLLRAQLQLLRTLVLYAHPYPCRHDRERAGGPGH